MGPIITRKALRSEINWINSKYEEVGFISSDYENELIVVAEIKNQRCGLGRMVVIDEKNLELGGIFVFQDYRGLGIAEEIVGHLCEENEFNQRNIWCLPFHHLKDFYLKFGFSELKRDDLVVPQKVLEKHTWCNSNYEQKVLMLVKEN
ncbi:GNAT family N-acetyltransferase [Xanthovirga aplysinae]|uniref:GNAT family N-acetyltransferase n=1 Tax=Xanthovirga aplysinae TaxID=2529853 RepID=UPI0012BD6380|nr:GNAT family N-acetyltransferase [Xanthovirga aplysinae]MTI31008.1 N-acetyltransferase [Xanthovirga aplysinae]